MASNVSFIKNGIWQSCGKYICQFWEFDFESSLMIWKEPPSIEALNQLPPNIAQLIGIEFTSWDENSLSARMPVDARTHQPVGILHGGASVVLAESLGSISSHMIIDSTKFMAVGLEVNANHIRPVTKGFVTGTCTPIHIGNKTHVWDIRIVDERGKLVCICRLTVAIVIKTTGP